MAKQIQLTLDNPCHENWDQMSASERGHFCVSCEKQVIDFAGMSDAQLVAFFQKHRASSICGRVYPDQLNRDIDVPARRIPWLKYFFSFVIPAFLITIKANAQSKLKSINGNATQRPRITDTLRKTLIEHTGLSDSVRHLAISVSDAGFKPTDIPVEDRSALERHRIIEPFIGSLGGISVTWKTKRRKVQAATQTKCEKTVPPTTQKVMDTAFKHFRVFPNPAPPGTSLNIEWKEMEEGYYMLELHDLSGKKLMTKEVWMDAGARVVNMEVPNLAAGSYLLAVTSKKSGRRFTEKVVVQ